MLVGRFLAAEINHRVRNIGVPVDAVSAGPKKQITGLERVELESVVAMREHGLEISTFAHPNILFACIARHVLDAGLRKHVINEARAIHSAVCRIGRAIFVAEILCR